MGEPVEVVIARRKRTLRDNVLTVVWLAAYVITIKIVEDVQTGAWQHSQIRLRSLALRERVDAYLVDMRQTAQFQAAVRQTLDNLDTLDDTGEVQS